MDRVEFLFVVKLLEAGSGKQLPDDGREVYFQILKNFPVEALQHAALEALRHGLYPVFPPIGVLHEHAQAFMRAGEAQKWRLTLEENYSREKARPVFGALADRLKRQAIEADLGPGRQEPKL